MQTSSPIVKTTALVCFVVLLSGFVAYRSGVFDKQAIKTKAIYSALDDTTKKPMVDTSAERLIMSSSKSMIIIDNRKSSKKDTVPATIKKDTIAKPITDTAKPTRFYGTKSGAIFNERDVETYIKKEKKKKKNLPADR
jgi:hypothetical protein